MESSQTILREVGEPQNANPTRSPEISARPSKRARLDTPPEEFMCAICCDTPSEDETFALRCDHRFCKACWTEYVTTKVKQEGQCFFRCMQDGCATAVDEPSIKQLADKACYNR